MATMKLLAAAGLAAALAFAPMVASAGSQAKKVGTGMTAGQAPPVVVAPAIFGVGVGTVVAVSGVTLFVAVVAQGTSVDGPAATATATTGTQ